MTEKQESKLVEFTGIENMVEAPRFVGGHIDELSWVMTVALMAGSNTLVIGKPGTGKTAPMYSYAEQVVGADRTAVLFCDDSTEPAEVKGSYDHEKWLNGEVVRDPAGTPWDPNMEVVLLDEIGRANSVVHNILISSVLNPKFWDRTYGSRGPVTFATSNFMPTEEVMAALSDRFDLWVWPKPGAIDVAAVVNAQMLGMVTGGGPQTPIPNGVTWDEIERVRTATPTPQAIETCQNFLQHLANAAREDGFNNLNFRRVTQWIKALFYATVWETGTADFTKIPPRAARILRYCHVSMTEDEADRWANTVDNVTDQAPIIIENRLTRTREILTRLQQAPASGKMELLTEATMEIQALETDLTRDIGQDPRIPATVEKSREWLAAAIRGETF